MRQSGFIPWLWADGVSSSSFSKGPKRGQEEEKKPTKTSSVPRLKTNYKV